MKVGDNWYKPDLVVKNDERILVVDVTVRYENYFLKAEKDKVAKYFLCLNHLISEYSVYDQEILPAVLGSRRATTPKTIEILMKLGIAKSEMKTIVMNVLRSSIWMFHVTLDRWAKYYIYLFIIIYFNCSIIIVMYLWTIFYLFIYHKLLSLTTSNY